MKEEDVQEEEEEDVTLEEEQVVILEEEEQDGMLEEEEVAMEAEDVREAEDLVHLEVVMKGREALDVEKEEEDMEETLIEVLEEEILVPEVGVEVL